MESKTQTIVILESELSRLLTWVQAAESRMALVLPLSTAMLGALSILSPSCSNWDISSALWASIATFFLILSIVFSAVSSFPRTDGPKGSIIYFGGISSMELSQYCLSVKNLTEDQYIDDLTNQCHRNAQIAERKFTWIQRAIACLFIASGPWAVSLFLFYSVRP